MHCRIKIPAPLQACLASLCYGLLPFAYARSPLLTGYLVLKFTVLTAAWVASAMQAFLLANAALEILRM
jgi:hypothetical protein